MLCAEWDEAIRVRCHNAKDRGCRGEWTAGRRVQKRICTIQRIKMMSLNIRAGQEGRQETAL